MNNRKILITILALVFILIFIFGFVLVFNFIQANKNKVKVNNFTDCANNGYAIMETYPRQCRDPISGKTFTEVIDNKPICEDKCGDGVCQEITCQAVGCPCSESADLCPGDCKSTNNGQTGLANPASTNCVAKGGVLEIRTDPMTQGQLGVCVFSDKTECEEWAFFRDECKIGQCKQECRSINTKSEGYYNSCTDKLIKWEICH
jgi:putative hemolysin